MSFGIAFIFALMAVGAVVAFAGDRLGRRVGQHRLSLFGLRPRHTSTLIAMGGGVSIVLLTIAVMLVLSQDAKTALFGLKRLQQNVAVLSENVASLEADAARLERYAGTLESTVSDLERTLASRNEELSRVNALLENESRKLAWTEGRLASVEREYVEARATIDELTVAIRQERERLEAISKERARLLSERQRLLEENAGLAAENARIGAENARLLEQSSELEARARSLADQLDGLKATAESLDDQVKQLEERRRQLEAENDFLDSRIQSLTSAGERMYASLAELRRGAITFAANEPIVAGKLSSDQSVEAVREKLKVLLQLAATVALERGAGRDPAGNVLVFKKAVLVEGADDNPDGRSIRYLSDDEILDAVSTAIVRQGTGEGVIVRVTSRANTLRSQPVPVEFELFKDSLIFSKGQEVATRVLNAELSKAQLFETLLAWLARDVNAVAREAGILPDPDGMFGEVPAGRIYDLVESIKQLGGLVRVRARAAAEIRTSGPLNLRFEIEPVVGPQFAP